MRLSARLAWVGVALTVCVSLYPFQGWRALSVHFSEFLTAPLPRVITPVDVASNLLAYMPLGALFMIALRQRLNTWQAILLSVLLAVSLSLALEIAQHFLPSRVPSNVDLAANSMGAMMGIAVSARWGHLATSGGRLDHAWQRWRDEGVGRGHETGIALLGLWWLAQWSPHTPLFGIGGMRQMLDIDAPGNFSVDRFVVFEALAVGAGVLAAGLMATSLLRRRRRLFALAVLVAGMVFKTTGVSLLSSHSEALAWLTPGALRGLLAGGVLLLLSAGLPASPRRALMACALLLATGLNNLIPDNPYLAPDVPDFPAAQWLNFDGLSRLAAVLWPFLALSWLMSARRTP